MSTDRTDDRPEDSKSPREPDELEGLLAQAFQDEPVPRLSSGFEARLERRLAVEGLTAARRPRRLPARARWFLALYWIAATGLCAVVLAWSHVAQAAHLPIAWPALAAVVVTAVVLALPFAALRRQGVSWTAVLRRALGA